MDGKQMERAEYTDLKGRKYESIQDNGERIILGPPEGLVDSLNLPEPFATNLHNALYRRRIFNLGSITKNTNNLVGALQEALSLDAQKLTEAFYAYEKE